MSNKYFCPQHGIKIYLPDTLFLFTPSIQSGNQHTVAVSHQKPAIILL